MGSFSIISGITLLEKTIYLHHFSEHLPFFMRRFTVPTREGDKNIELGWGWQMQDSRNSPS